MVDRRVQIAVVALVVVLMAGAGGFFLLRDNGKTDPVPLARAYLDRWQDGDYKAMKKLVADPPSDFTDRYDKTAENLKLNGATYQLTGSSTAKGGDEAIARFKAQLDLKGLGTWSYQGLLHLTHTGAKSYDGWRVDWSPASIHPALKEHQVLTRTRQRPERAPILDKDGKPLVVARAAEVIGLHPRRIKDLNQVKAALQSTLQVDPADVDKKLHAPGVKPDHFVEIITVDKARYESVKPIIYPIPGTVFRQTTLRGGPTPGFAQHILGRTGEVTAELLGKLGPSYQAGDIVGLTGLEARFEEQLAGTPSGDVRIEDRDGKVIKDLGHIKGKDPKPVKTTLDPTVQSAVEAALAGIAKPAAVVAVDSKGNIRASASRPLEEFNRAFAGAYPPGSTFKIVSGSALLSKGTTPATPVNCPQEANAGGRVFHNHEQSSLGTVPFGVAFAQSCNTAFILATADLPAADLTNAAQQFGFNTKYDVGLNTKGGSFPTPTNDTDKAAATIGQGKVTASPLHMATVAAAVIDGTWETPVLLPDAPMADPPTSTQIPQSTVQALTGLMRRVVSEGTATSAKIPGTPLAGKTGTAEFGTGNPPHTHAWFVAFRGDLAVAVLVEDGGYGGQVAAPIAAKIFTALPQ